MGFVVLLISMVSLIDSVTVIDKVSAGHVGNTLVPLLVTCRLFVW